MSASDISKVADRADIRYRDGLILQADIGNPSPSGVVIVTVKAHPIGSTASFQSFEADRANIVRRVAVMKGATWPEGSNPSLDPDVKPLDNPDRELDAICPDLLREAYEGRAGTDQSAT